MIPTKIYGWQKIWMAKNGKKMDGKKYGWQKMAKNGWQKIWMTKNT